MDRQLTTPTLRTLRYELARIIAQTEFYEKGHADWEIENAIYAAHKRNEMIAQLRTRASSLQELIAAYEEANA
jgi:hypothetical protein